MKTERQKRIFDSLTPCKVFGDVGCDHGRFTLAMLVSGKAERAVYSDISAKSLQKAEKLLADYAAVSQSVVCDGIERRHASCDEILIAGMGGAEVIKILSRAPQLPKRLVVQPMKDAEAVRRAMDALGYLLVEDIVFPAEGKYYYLIAGELDGDSSGAADGAAGGNAIAKADGIHAAESSAVAKAKMAAAFPILHSVMQNSEQIAADGREQTADGSQNSAGNGTKNIDGCGIQNSADGGTKNIDSCGSQNTNRASKIAGGSSQTISKNHYTEAEFRFGRGTLASFPPVFTEILQKRRGELKEALLSASEKTAPDLQKELNETEEYLGYAAQKNSGNF